MIFWYIVKIFFTMLHLKKIFLEYWIILYIFRILLCVTSPQHLLNYSGIYENFMNFDFIFNFFFQCKKIYILKLIVALNFSLLRYDTCFWSFFFLLKGRSTFRECESHNLCNLLTNGFFNLHLTQTKCSVYITNLFCLLTINSHSGLVIKYIMYYLTRSSSVSKVKS